MLCSWCYIELWPAKSNQLVLQYEWMCKAWNKWSTVMIARMTWKYWRHKDEQHAVPFLAGVNRRSRVCVTVRYPRLQVGECVCEDDVEHGVGSAALFVHVCSRHCSWLVSLWHQRLDVLWEVHTPQRKVFFSTHRDDDKNIYHIYSYISPLIPCSRQQPNGRDHQHTAQRHCALLLSELVDFYRQEEKNQPCVI